MGDRGEGGAGLVRRGEAQRRCDMCHELLTQHALFVLESMPKGMLSQHFVMHALGEASLVRRDGLW